MASELTVSVISPAGAATLAESKASVEAMPDAPPKGKMDMMKSGGKMISGGMKKAGISFGLSSILKQSQIFTGFLGSVFQIVGGLVDVLLAPLMPILIPVLQILAKSIPIVSKVANFVIGGLVGLITPVFAAIGNLWNSFSEAWGFIKEGRWGEAAKTIGSAIWDYAMSLLSVVFNIQPLVMLHKFLTNFEWYNHLMDGIKEWFSGTLDSIKNLWDICVAAWDYFAGGEWIDGIVDFFKPVVDWTNNFMDGVIDFFRPLTDSVLNLWDGFSEAWGFIKEGKWAEAARTLWDNVWDTIKTYYTTLFDAILLPFVELHKWLTSFEWYNKLIEGLKNFLAPVVDLGRNMIDWAIGFYNEKIRAWIQPILDGMFGLFNSAKLWGDKIVAPQLAAMELSSDPRPSEITVTVGNTTGQELEMDIKGAKTAISSLDTQLGQVS